MGGKGEGGGWGVQRVVQNWGERAAGGWGGQGRAKFVWTER